MLKQIMSELPKNVGNLVSQKSAGPNPIQGIVEIFQSRQRYLQFKESEKTRRLEISKQAEIEIVNIREKTQLLRDYLGMAFAERHENFERCFKILDEGLNNNNDKQIDAGLSLIVSMIKESPLKQSVEIMRNLKNRSSDEIIDI